MPVHKNSTDAIAALDAELPQTVSRAVRKLLETRHLYQSIRVDLEGLLKSYIVPTGVNTMQLELVTTKVATWPWIATDRIPGPDALVAMVAAKNSSQKRIEWPVPDIKVYCHTCGREEPFNPDSSRNLPGEVYVLSYICQSCKGPPHVFLVRKSGYKLTVCGRTPMEHTEVPKAVPKTIVKYFSGAQIAYQSGQTLAGLFLLRTLSEQWALEHADEGSLANKALEAYMETLPADFKSRFPSLVALYSDLSAALHGADADTALYERAIGEIQEHFEARALYKLPPPLPREK